MILAPRDLAFHIFLLVFCPPLDRLPTNPIVGGRFGVTLGRVTKGEDAAAAAQNVSDKYVDHIFSDLGSGS